MITKKGISQLPGGMAIRARKRIYKARPAHMRFIRRRTGEDPSQAPFRTCVPVPGTRLPVTAPGGAGIPGDGALRRAKASTAIAPSGAGHRPSGTLRGLLRQGGE